MSQGNQIRVERAVAMAQSIAHLGRCTEPDDAAVTLRRVANFLLRRAAELTEIAPVCCPNCGASDSVNRLAWVDGRTGELVEMIDPAASPAVDDPFWCGQCFETVTP